MAPGRWPVRAYPAAHIGVTPGRRMGPRAVRDIELANCVGGPLRREALADV